MRTILLLLVSGGAALASQQEASRDFQKNVPLAAGQRLNIEHSFGEVTVRGAAQKEVAIRATLRAAGSSREDAEKVVNSIEILVDQNSAGVFVRTKYPDQGFFRRNMSYSVSYDITMPDASALEVKNSFGGVSVSDIRGAVTVKNGHGRLRSTGCKGAQRLDNSFGSIEVLNAGGDVIAGDSNGSIRIADVTGSVEARSSFGGVTVERAGQNVTVTNSNGAVTVTDAGGEARLNSSFGAITASGIGKAVTVTGSNGSVRVTRAGGPANVRTNFGSIELNDINGGVEAHNSNGTIRITGIKGAARLTTTFGSLVVNDLSGPLDATNSNGSVQATLTGASGCRPVTIRATFGPVKVWLPEPANYDVSAATSFGKVSSEFPLTVSGQISSESVNGKIGNGGCELRISNSNGSVQILKASGK